MKTMKVLALAIVISQLQAGGLKAQGIWVNQAGYLPDRQKLAYTIETSDSFYVVDNKGGDIVFRGKPQLTSSKDPSTGWMTYICDFSSLNREGDYRIATDAPDTSFGFAISSGALADVYTKSLKGFYFQRCGTALLSQHAGVYARSTCHTHDAVFHSSTGQSGSIVTTGGWHDAGDYGKYVVNAGITVGTLLLAYELFPEKFKSDDLNIPESGNSVPDILDEVRHELEWMLEMQDTVDGGVYFKVTTANFDAFEMPSQDVLPRYIYQKSSTATGDFAAVTAQAARIYSAFDTAFASKCLAAAEMAWQYLLANPSIVPTGGFRNPTGTGTGEYGDGNDSDERLWSAAELFVTTGNSLYHNYFKEHYNDAGMFGSTMGWADVRDMAQIAYLTGKESGADSTIKLQLKNSLDSYCTSLANISSADGLNVTLRVTDYYWGSNSIVMNNAVLLIIGYDILGDQDYYNVALGQLNYVLGCNVKNMSYVTGVGTVYPMHIHHRPSGSDGIMEPIPGLIAGGPEAGLDDPVLKSNYTSSTPPARCYIDDQGSYASNEIAINWNAPLVFVSGYFNESPATSARRIMPGVPAKFELTQNFPNPFNPLTVINYQLPVAGFVTLRVYDVLGREVETLVNKHQTAGSHSISFDAGSLPSGVYFYRLNAGSLLDVKKMIVLK